MNGKIVFPVLVGSVSLPFILNNLFGIHNGLAIGILTATILLWLTEVIPLAVTSLLIPTLAIATGVLPEATAFHAFGNQILFLFIGVFLLAIAMQKHGWDKRMAIIFLSNNIINRSLNRIILAVSLICWTFSMWVSNTATCALMLPIAIGLTASVKERFKDETIVRNFSYRILITCAFASSIGGLATPVGSPPNLIALQFLSDQGLAVSFSSWMAQALPISVVMLIVLNVILAKRYPLDIPAEETKLSIFGQQKNSSLHITTAEKQVALCFGLTLLLWFLPGILGLSPDTAAFGDSLGKRLPMGSAALIGAAILFCLPDQNGKRNLEWQDAKALDWGTILLFGGGICLGEILFISGLATEIGGRLFELGGGNWMAVGAISILAAILLSEFASNTAAASIMIPLLIGGLGTRFPDQTRLLVLATAFGTSFGFALPVSTPPNAIVIGSGLLPTKELFRSGIVFDFCGFLIIAIAVLLLYPLILNL